MKNINCTLSIKELGPDKSFCGYAVVFGVLDTQGDVIKRGAFMKNKNNFNRNIKLLWQHDYKQPIGVVKFIEEDDYGLYVKAHLLTEISKAHEAYVMLKHGAINGLSIGYTATSYYIDEAKGVRFIDEIELWEISLVTFPANELAKVVYVKDSTSKTTTETLLHDAQSTLNKITKHYKNKVSVLKRSALHSK